MTDTAKAVPTAPGTEADIKTLERTVEEHPAGSEMEESVKAELAASEGAVEAKVAEKESAEKDTGASASVEEKEKAKTETESEKEDKVVQDAVKQITFYLSDSNLPYDKFLFTQAQKSLEGNADAPMGTGWIPLSTILSFKRMQELIGQSARSATICEYAIVSALRSAYPSSDSSALLTISEDGHSIRRKKELVPPSTTGIMERSVYAKGFPDEDEKDQPRKGKRSEDGGSALQKDLETFFEKLGIGKVNAVRMRRDDEKKFKNSVFVEWATLDSAKAFLELDPKPTYAGQEQPLETMSKKEYIDMKAKEKGIDPQYTTNPRAAANKDNASGRNAKRPFNAFRDYKNGKLQEDNRRSGNNRNSGPVTVFVEGKEFEVDETSGKLKKPEEITFQSGKIVKFEGASTGEESNPVELKRSLTSILPPAFVDFDRGNTSGIVFFKDPVSSEKLESLQNSGLTLGGESHKLSWTAITGEEEKMFHLERANKRAAIALAERESGGSNNDRRGGDDRRGGGRGDDRDRRGGGRGGRGGRGGGRGGRGGNRGGRDGDRNAERRENERKRSREDDSESAPAQKKATSIAAPGEFSSGPEQKKAKTDE